MRTDGLLAIPDIMADKIPPIDPVTDAIAKTTGETFIDAKGESHIVYRMHFIDLEATMSSANRKPVIDPDTGKQQHRKNSDTGDSYPVWHRPPVFVEEEFILERASAEIRIQRNFRPSEDELATRRNAQLVASFEKTLATEAVKRGLTPEELVNRIMGSLDGDAAQVAAQVQAVGDDNVRIVPVSPGWFNVEVDGQQMSSKSLRKEDAEALADTFRVPAGAGVEEGGY